MSQPGIRPSGEAGGPGLLRYQHVGTNTSVNWGVPVESISAGQRAYVMRFDERNIERAVYCLL
ncbi:MAG: hypothetical protein H7Z14_07030 [Anaerolineae bacterium]|nr:hypothetical protein [Phycisphaerae bacterium]